MQGVIVESLEADKAEGVVTLDLAGRAREGKLQPQE